MNLLNLLFGAGPALHFIFKMGYIPNANDFLELTEQQYADYFVQHGETEEKIFVFCPPNPSMLDEEYNDISCFSKFEIDSFKDAEEMINRYCKGDESLDTTHKKLSYVASKLPSTFTLGTAYEKYHHLSVVKK